MDAKQRGQKAHGTSEVHQRDVRERRQLTMSVTGAWSISLVYPCMGYSPGGQPPEIRDYSLA